MLAFVFYYVTKNEWSQISFCFRFHYRNVLNIQNSMYCSELIVNISTTNKYSKLKFFICHPSLSTHWYPKLSCRWATVGLSDLRPNQFKNSDILGMHLSQVFFLLNNLVQDVLNVSHKYISVVLFLLYTSLQKKITKIFWMVVVINDKVLIFPYSFSIKNLNWILEETMFAPNTFR